MYIEFFPLLAKFILFFFFVFLPWEIQAQHAQNCVQPQLKGLVCSKKNANTK